MPQIALGLRQEHGQDGEAELSNKHQHRAPGKMDEGKLLETNSGDSKFLIVGFAWFWDEQRHTMLSSG